MQKREAQCNPTTIPDLLADANKILRQRGITLAQAGEAHILNNTNWLDHADVLSANAPSIDAMMDSTNSMGQAVELYFVRSLDGTTFRGACRMKGIALISGANSEVVAHEVLHACGLDDICTANGQEIPGPVSQGRVPSDWGGGYYAPGMTQRELVARLIMRSGGEEEIDTETPNDLPSGTVYGWKHSDPDDGSSPKVLGQAGVGQSSVQQTPRSY